MGALSAVLVLVTGFWTTIVTPDRLAEPPACGGGPAMAAAETLLVVAAHVAAGAVPQDTVRYYNLGYHHPAEVLRRRLQTPTLGWGWTAVATRRERSRTWSCWSPWLLVCSDSSGCGVTGDLNGDGLADISDLSVLAAAMLSGTEVVFPGLASPDRPPVRPLDSQPDPGGGSRGPPEDCTRPP